MHQKIAHLEKAKRSNYGSDAVAKLAKIQGTLAATRGRGHNQQLRQEIAGDMKMLEKKIRELDEKTKEK